MIINILNRIKDIEWLMKNDCESAVKYSFTDSSRGMKDEFETGTLENWQHNETVGGLLKTIIDSLSSNHSVSVLNIEISFWNVDEKIVKKAKEAGIDE